MNIKADIASAFQPDGASAFQPDGASDSLALKCLVLVAQHHGIHTTVSQLMHDNMLSGTTVTPNEMLKCAQSAGLVAQAVQLDWSKLLELKKALPAIVTMKNQVQMVLRGFEGEGDAVRVLLQDPAVDDDAVLAIDRVRFESIWTGDVLLVKRDYEISDENQPFRLKLLAALLFREKRIVRDVFLCAFILGILALAPILYWRILSHRVLPFGAWSTFEVITIAVAILFLFEAIFLWIRRYLVLHLTLRLDVKLSTYVFEKLLRLPIDYFERNQVGKIAHDMSQLGKIRGFLTGQLLGTVLDSTTLLIFLPVMFFISPLVTLFVMAVCLAIVAWLLLMMPAHRQKSRAAENAATQQGAFLVQTISGVRTVKSLALDSRQMHRWDIHVARLARCRFAEGDIVNKIQAVARPLERLAVSGALALLIFEALSSGAGLSNLSAYFGFVMLTNRVAGPLVNMAQLINQYDEARYAVEVVGEIANQPEEEGRSGNGVRTPLEGDIQFSDVTFKYKGATSPSLEKLTFNVPAGYTLGIMGRSGSGKTTVTRLLQRLHSSYDGLIKIDKIDVREYDLDHLRRSVGVVLQENFLFSGTIRENISIAKADATFDEIVQAARLAGAEEFIDKLPRGYETYIYEGSPNLSGGQRQRLAIARALIIDPRILIFDEATSALDPESEAILANNISRISRGRTVIIVSHRLSSLMNADAILVLDNGKGVDLGTHEELLSRCEIYSRLWHQQNRHLLAPAATRNKPIFRNPSLVS
jgi:subfamily B ATP-binding cassette protein HlyB/CyaB